MKLFQALNGFLKKKYPHLILIALLFVVSLAVSAKLPERTPLHWDKQGVVDRYGSKYELVFLLPSVSVVLFALGVAAEKRHILPSHKTRGVISFFQFFFILLVFVFQLYGLFRALNFSVALESLSAPLFIALFLYMGHVIKASEFRSSYGVKTKWTMSDPMVWRKTSHLAFILFNIGSASMAFIIFIPKLLYYTIPAQIAAYCVIVVLYSKYVYNKNNQKTNNNP
ncbi:MAG: DUF1648 domain-containing protein [Oscillospiraceae bacterium]|nr:DUF1648 domain-containing protein [Oscillospiraceae bacterium]